MGTRSSLAPEECSLGQARQEAGTGMSPQPGLEEAHFSFYASMGMISLPGGICLRRGAEAEQSV